MVVWGLQFMNLEFLFFDTFSSSSGAHGISWLQPPLMSQAGLAVTLAVCFRLGESVMQQLPDSLIGGHFQNSNTFQSHTLEKSLWCIFTIICWHASHFRCCNNEHKMSSRIIILTVRLSIRPAHCCFWLLWITHSSQHVVLHFHRTSWTCKHEYNYYWITSQKYVLHL